MSEPYWVPIGGAPAYTAPAFLAPNTIPGSSSQVFPANLAWLLPIMGLSGPFTPSRILYCVATQSGNIDQGVYYTDDEITFTRLFSTGSYAVPAGPGLTVKAVVGVPLIPQPGRRFFIAQAVDNGTAAFVADASCSARMPYMSYSHGTSFPLPLTLTGCTGPANSPQALPYLTLAI